MLETNAQQPIAGLKFWIWYTVQNKEFYIDDTKRCKWQFNKGFILTCNVVSIIQFSPSTIRIVRCIVFTPESYSYRMIQLWITRFMIRFAIQIYSPIWNPNFPIQIFPQFETQNFSLYFSAPWNILMLLCIQYTFSISFLSLVILSSCHLFSMWWSGSGVVVLCFVQGSFSCFWARKVFFIWDYPFVELQT